jgi:hypothetical protein
MRHVTIVEGEDWAYAFTRKRDAERFRARLPYAMLRTLLDALAFDHHAIGRVDSDGIIDPTFGGIVHPAAKAS